MSTYLHNNLTVHTAYRDVEVAEAILLGEWDNYYFLEAEASLKLSRFHIPGPIPPTTMLEPGWRC